MTRLTVAAAAFTVLTCLMPAGAGAYEQNYGAYGYETPDRFKRGQKTEKPAEQAVSIFDFGLLKNKSKAGLAENEMLKKGKKFANAESGREADGGGQPNIAPMAPPVVSFPNSFGSGTIVIDTAGRKLYYVLTASTAYQYPIAVGKQGFTWTGTEQISKKVAWPDWTPPAEMLERKPELPAHMTGGVRNPLGAMALYLGSSLYRIHGTNDVKSIGTAASSGCIRMTNGNVVHLASIAGVGTTVHVLNKLPSHIAKATKSAKAGTEG